MLKIHSYPINFYKELDSIIDKGLKEDLGSGDCTSIATIAPRMMATGKLLVKSNGIIAGLEVAERIFRKIDKETKIRIIKRDGQKVCKGDIAFTVHGNARSLLAAERLTLNCMQRMSGIATQAHYYTALCTDTGAKVLDTRKTTPGIRLLEKWAVAIGGAYNHRYGLFDMILIKDNHIDCSGGIKNAITSAQSYLKRTRKKLNIEIEARNLKEVEDIIETGGVNRILLDNLPPTEVAKAIKMIDGRFESEVSGGINEKNIKRYARTGVNFISTGSLTHSVKCMDMSLKITPGGK